MEGFNDCVSRKWLDLAPSLPASLCSKDRSTRFKVAVCIHGHSCKKVLKANHQAHAGC